MSNGRALKGSTDAYHLRRIYQLIRDDGVVKRVSNLKLGMALKLGISPDLIQHRCYGEAANPSLTRPPFKKRPPTEKKWERILFLEESLRRLKQAHISGDFSYFAEYYRENISRALQSVSPRIGASVHTLREYDEHIFNLYFDTIQNMEFTCVKPMYNILCQCVKYAYLRNRSTRIKFRDLQYKII